MARQTFGRYEIVEELARGGMATVYHAYDPRFRRDVALKLLPRELLHQPEFRQRFEREALAIAVLEHAAIVPVHDYGEEMGQLFLVMRLMKGGSLSERLQRALFTMQEAAVVLQPIASALDFAHSKGVVHRDIKPANILFDETGLPYLTDFGIAKLMGDESPTLTAKGGMMGTPAFMSPEQVQGEEIDGRSDVYSLTGVFYAMLTGRPAFESATPMGLALKQLTEPVPDIRAVSPQLPAATQEIIERGMAKSPEERFQTAGELAAAVAELAGGVGPSRFSGMYKAAAVGAAVQGPTEPKPATPPYGVGGQVKPASVYDSEETMRVEDELPPVMPVGASQPRAAEAKTRNWLPIVVGGLFAVLVLMLCSAGVAIAYFAEIGPFEGAVSQATATGTVDTFARTATALVRTMEAAERGTDTPSPEVPTWTPPARDPSATVKPPILPDDTDTPTPAAASATASLTPKATPVAASDTPMPSETPEPTVSATPAATSYSVTVKTGCNWFNDTDNQVFIQLNGENGSTGDILLANASGPNFENCALAVFSVAVEQDLGELVSIEFYSKKTGFSNEWFLEWAHVRNTTTDQEWQFPCGRELRINENGESFTRIPPGGPCS